MDADVVVIGAGAAGLAAARTLAGRSLRVIVVEARDREGGRVWSEPSAGDRAPAELGAEFIHGPAKETRTLLRDAGLVAVDTGGESWRTSEDGDLSRTDDDEFRSAACLFEGVRTLASDESVDRFLRRFDDDGAMKKAVDAARTFVEGFDAADPAIASALAIADEWRSGVDFASARPLGGYAPMFEYLRQSCAAAGVQTFLSTAARQIAWSRGEVKISAENSAGSSPTIRARAAIVTVSIGVLRHRGGANGLTFQPELPEAKLKSIASIEMGDAVRVVLKFRTPFWERIRNGCYRDAGFFRFVGQTFPTYWTQLPIRGNSLIAWVGGPKATALSGASPTDLIDRALSGLGAIFREPALVRAEFERGFTHDWSRDPFARGAYSYVAVDGGDARATLGAPVEDTLFFAGEATANDGQGGTVNGALETGERAAREAANSLGAAAQSYG